MTDFSISSALPGFIVFFLLTNAKMVKTDDGLIFLIHLHYWGPGRSQTIQEEYVLPRVYLLEGGIFVSKALCEFSNS